MAEIALENAPSIRKWSTTVTPIPLRKHQASQENDSHTRSWCLDRGGMFARRANFLLTIPTSAPDLPSHGEAPQEDHVALHTFPTKHVA